MASNIGYSLACGSGEEDVFSLVTKESGDIKKEHHSKDFSDLCQGLPSAYSGETLARELGLIGKMWSELTSGTEEVDEEFLSSLDRFSKYLEEELQEGTSSTQEGSVKELLILCWSEQESPRADACAAGGLMASVLSVLSKVERACSKSEQRRKAVGGVVSALLRLLHHNSSSNLSKEQLESVLTVMLDGDFYKSEFIAQSQPEGCNLLKDVVTNCADRYKLMCAEEEALVGFTLSSYAAESVGNPHFCNQLDKKLSSMPTNTDLIYKCDEITTSCKYEVTVKLISYSSIPSSVRGFSLKVMEEQKQNTGNLSELESKLAEVALSEDALGKMIGEKIKAAEERVGDYEEAFILSMMSSMEANSCVIDKETGRAVPKHIRITAKSVEKARRIYTFISEHSSQKEQHMEMALLMFSGMNWVTEDASLSTLIAAEEVLKLFGHKQVSELHAASKEKAEEVTRDIAEMYKDLLESAAALPAGNEQILLVKLKKISLTAHSVISHLPKGLLSEREAVRMAVESLSKENANALAAAKRVLSGWWMLEARKVIEKISEKTASSMPRELGISLSKLDGALGISRFGMALRGRGSPPRKERKQHDVEGGVLEVLGFCYSQKYDYYYQNRSELPTSYALHTMGNYLPTTSSDHGTKVTVDGKDYAVQNSLIQDLRRSLYTVCGVEISANDIDGGTEGKNEAEVTEEMSRFFVKEVAKLGLTPEAFEVLCAIMNQSSAAVMLNTGWIVSHLLFPVQAGIGINEEFSGTTKHELRVLPSGQVVMTCSISGVARALYVQEKERYVDVKKDVSAHRQNSNFVFTDPELLAGIDISSSMEVLINTDGTIRIIKLKYELPNLTPERVESICSSQGF
ncbi:MULTISPECIES: hypothetical protein [Candidatus Ichthyocystis]|uniref:hypothetical protein n=1 Tax=Candidatus Ichthyocystis TaxID=2929841 RepID=UPI000B83B1B6|nr:MULTISPECIES: hypothetical protein [Ichthyocystis]